MKASFQRMLLFALFLPVSLLAQESYSRQEIPFDKDYFKELNYEMLELFSAETYPSPTMTCFMFIESIGSYGIGGTSDKTKNESLIVEELVERKNAESSELQENTVVKPGDELLNYFLENLDPETIISYRVVAKEKVQVKRYELIY